MTYPSNSHKAKEAAMKKKKVEPVVRKGKIRKKSLIGRIEDTFIVEGAKEHIFGDLIVPSVKRTFLDIMGYLLGDDRGKSASKTSYGKYYQEKDRRSGPTNGRIRGYTYDDVVVSSRQEAMDVLAGLNDIIRDYQIASVADLYDLANIQSDNWTSNKYGWTNISGARVIVVSDGYLIKMPRPMPIDPSM